TIIAICYRTHRYLHSFPTRRSSDLFPNLFGRSVEFVSPFKFHNYSPALKWINGRGNGLLNNSNLLGSIKSICSVSEHHRITTRRDRKSTRLNSSHVKISYAVFCLKK